MPREIPLTEFQKSWAVIYRNNGKTITEIVGTLKTGESPFAEFLKNPDAHRKKKKKKKTGRPPKITPKEQRHFLWQLKKGASILAAQPESGLTD